jgi:hypothetical protein
MAVLFRLVLGLLNIVGTHSYPVYESYEVDFYSRLVVVLPVLEIEQLAVRY